MGEMDRVLYSMYNTFGKSFRNVQEKVLKVQYSHKSALLSPVAGCVFSCQKPATCPSTCTIYTYTLSTQYHNNIYKIYQHSCPTRCTIYSIYTLYLHTVTCRVACARARIPPRVPAREPRSRTCHSSSQWRWPEI